MSKTERQKSGENSVAPSKFLLNLIRWVFRSDWFSFSTPLINRLNNHDATVHSFISINRFNTVRVYPGVASGTYPGNSGARWKNSALMGNQSIAGTIHTHTFTCSFTSWADLESPIHLHVFGQLEETREPRGRKP